MKIYTFNKEGKEWFVDLPGYIQQGGSKVDLQMVSGADTMLDLIAKGGSSVKLSMAEEEFEASYPLTLIERCDPPVGGGNYLLKEFEGKELNQHIWLCDVVQYEFGKIPDALYIRREND